MDECAGPVRVALRCAPPDWMQGRFPVVGKREITQEASIHMTHHTPAPSIRGTPVRVITDIVTLKATSADTGATYAAFEIETPPSGGFPPHTQQDDAEGFYVIEGIYTFLVGDREFTLGAGDFLHVQRGTLHGYVNPGTTPSRMLVVATPGRVQETFFADIGDNLDRPVWEPDMARFLAVAPNHGIQIPTADTADPRP